MRVGRFTAFSIGIILISAIGYAENYSHIESGESLAQVEAATTSYDSIFPYYTVQCSFSQERKNDGHNTSIMGHTVLYLKGACRDQSVPYPKLKMCEPETGLNSKASGVAISVEKMVSNSQYIASDGLDFFLNGASSPNEPLTTRTIEDTVSAVLASGSLNGVKIHESYMRKKPVGMSTAEYIARVGVGTDFAVSIGRDSSCARIPMTRSQIQAEVNYINETNEPYVSGAEEFFWNAVGDNCAHFSHDVLAAAGIRHQIPRSNSWTRMAYNFLSIHWEIPTNDVLKDLEFANDVYQIRGAEEVYMDRDEREFFDKFGTLPRLGATLEEIPMHLFENSVFKPNSPETFLLDFPVIDNRGKKFRALTVDPVYTHVSENLKRVLARLQEIQGLANGTVHPVTFVAAPSPTIEISPSPSPSEVDPDVERAKLADFTVRYNAWIDQSIVDIQDKLTKIAQAKAQ